MTSAIYPELVLTLTLPQVEALLVAANDTLNEALDFPAPINDNQREHLGQAATRLGWALADYEEEA